MAYGEKQRHGGERDENYKEVHESRDALLDSNRNLRRRGLVPVLPLRFEPHRVLAFGHRRKIDRLLAVALAPRLAVLDAVVILNRQLELLDQSGLFVD